MSVGGKFWGKIQDRFPQLEPRRHERLRLLGQFLFRFPSGT
jgi:hypothetical protein